MNNNKKALLRISFFSLFFFLLLIMPLFNENSFHRKVFANEIEELEKMEQEREEDFLKQLLLDIPTITDNPSNIITFIDPSEDKSGVEIEIDENTFEEIKSPYTLPALSIGKHSLRFRFVDKYGSVQILEREIIVIPRPPIINSPIFEENFLKMSGSGLANSELVLILSSERNILVKEGTIDGDGNWALEIDYEELTEGIFTFSAFTKRYGYASNLSEPLTFEIGNSERLLFQNEREIYFKFKDLSLEDMSSVLSGNIDLVVLVAISFLSGFAISLIVFSFVKGNKENKTLKMFEKKMDNNDNHSTRELTLKEKLSQEDKEEKPKESKETEEKSKKKNKTEKILTKVDFLKDYKNFDPDDEKGSEKENIEVKVTSKK
jgi:hypothetical protein